MQAFLDHMRTAYSPKGQDFVMEAVQRLWIHQYHPASDNDEDADMEPWHTRLEQWFLFHHRFGRRSEAHRDRWLVALRLALAVPEPEWQSHFRLYAPGPGYGSAAAPPDHRGSAAAAASPDDHE